jgi:UDP-N-acetylglucosamine transferase subunit ALG13
VGNAKQSFSRLLDEVARLAHLLPQPVVVQHGMTPFSIHDCEAIPFVGMSEFEQLVVEAELLIMHAGAGAVIHAVRAGKVPVLMPRRAKYGEHVDDHQVEFAKALEAAGRVVLAHEPIQLGDAVRRALEMQHESTEATNPPLMVRLIDETLIGYTRRYL